MKGKDNTWSSFKLKIYTLQKNNVKKVRIEEVHSKKVFTRDAFYKVLFSKVHLSFKIQCKGKGQPD